MNSPNTPSRLPRRAILRKPGRKNPGTKSHTKTFSMRRGSGFSQVKIDHLLGLINRDLPVGRDEWNFFIAEYKKYFQLQKRNVDSLRRKFASLHRKKIKIPTEDHFMPAYVRRSKHILYEMTGQADMGVEEEGRTEKVFPMEEK